MVRFFADFARSSGSLCPPAKRCFAAALASGSHRASLLEYYNRCRGHSACWGFTPDEVFSGKPATAPLGELELFDGMLTADHFTSSGSLACGPHSGPLIGSATQRTAPESSRSGAVAP